MRAAESRLRLAFTRPGQAIAGLRPALACLCLAAAFPVFAAPQPGLSLSGSSRTGLSLALPDEGGTRYGLEQYTSLRLRARAGEKAVFNAALNLLAASGSAAAQAARAIRPLGAAGLVTSPLVSGSGYASALELERLYVSLKGEGLSCDLGLFRLPFGFGPVLSPMDFLSSRNPLIPEARPRGRLGAAATLYPSPGSKLLAFSLAPKDALDADGESTILGVSAETHGRAGSAQLLYAFEAPSAASGSGIHRAGLSLKLEGLSGLVLDALYTLDPEAARKESWYGSDWTWQRGLGASAALDRSLGGGKLYLLGQYLYHGPGFLDPEAVLSESAPAPPAGYAWPLIRRNYLFALARWRIDDYSSIGLSCLASLDDLSAAPALEIEHEPFQGLSLSLELRMPVDGSVFGDLEAGELGPERQNSRLSLKAAAALKF